MSELGKLNHYRSDKYNLVLMQKMREVKFEVSQYSIEDNRSDVVAKLCGFFERERPNLYNSIDSNTNLIDHGILDSLLTVALVLFIEKEFGCDLDFNDLNEDNLGSIDSMADLVMNQLN